MKRVKRISSDRTPNTPEEFQNWHKKTIDIFSSSKFERILDVGCAGGNFSLLLKEACGAKEVCGIEIDECGANLARQKGVGAHCLNLDHEAFPFEGKYFDAIYVGEVIEHLYDPDHMLEECYRVLKYGGLLVLTTRNLSSLYNRLTLLLGYQPFSTSVSLRHNIGRPFKLDDEILGDHIRVFTYRALREILELNGFDCLVAHGTGSALPPGKGNYFAQSIRLCDKILARVPSLSQGLALECRKR